jgi:hypothetical protein
VQGVAEANLWGGTPVAEDAREKERAHRYVRRQVRKRVLSHPSARGPHEFFRHTTSIDLAYIKALPCGRFSDCVHEFARERFQTQSDVIASN